MKLGRNIDLEREKKKEKNTIKMNSVLLSDDQSNHHFF
jgi:hypothetical protein